MTGIHVVLVPAWWPSPEQPMAGVFWTDYAEAFASAGARVGIVVPDLVSVRYMGGGTSIPWIPRVSEERFGDVPVVRIRGLHTAARIPAVQMHRFRRWLRRGLAVYRRRFGPPDVLHAMCAIPSGWACTHLDATDAPPVVVTEQTGSFDRLMTRRHGGPYIRAGLARAAAAVTVSEHNRGIMQAAGVGREIAVCGNPVSMAFMHASIRAPRPNAALRALFVGRLVEGKGVRELGLAAARLDTGRDIEWHFVGDGPEASGLRRVFADHGRASRLRLHGRCDRSTIVKIMTDADLLVHPTHGETFGMAVAEALCMGLPAITTRGTACAEFVTDDNGLLVDPRDVGSLTDGLGRLIDRLDSFDRAAIAENARRRFSADAVARWYAELFRRLSSERAAADAAS